MSNNKAFVAVWSIWLLSLLLILSSAIIMEYAPSTPLFKAISWVNLILAIPLGAYFGLELQTYEWTKRKGPMK